MYQGKKIRFYKRTQLSNANKEERERATLLKITTTPGLLSPDRDIPILTETLAGMTGSSRSAIWRLLPDGNSLVCEDLYDIKKSVHAVGMELERGVNQNLFQALEDGHSLSVEVGDITDKNKGTEGLSRMVSQAGLEGNVVFYPILNMHRAIGALTLTTPKYLEQGDLIISLVSAIVGLRFSATDYQKTDDKMKGNISFPATEQAFKHLPGFLIDPTEKNLRGAPGSGLYPDVPIMVLQLNRAYSKQHNANANNIALVELLAETIQTVCKNLSIFALQVLGNRVVFLGDCSLETDPNAITKLAEAALQIREKCLAILAEKDTKVSFSIGIDMGVALVSHLGNDPKVFNLWGNSLATAELLAETAPGEGVIQVSETAHQKLKDNYLFRPRGNFYLPDTGVSTSYILAGRW